MTRMADRMKMANLLRFLDRHNVTFAELARATKRKSNSVHNAIRRGQMSYECCLMLAALFEAEGWKVPKNLFVTTEGKDCYALPPLHALSDARVITVRNPSGAYSRSHRIHRYLSPQQLNPQGDTEMVRLSLSAAKRFGLRADPFSNEMRCIDDVWQHPEHKKCLQAVEEAARNKDLLYVIGESGCGKTTVRNTFIETCPENLSVIMPLAVGRANMSDSNLLDAVIHDLAGDGEFKGTIPIRREAKARKVLRMLEAQTANGRGSVLFIDDAHRLPKETLRDIKVLHEMQRGYRALLGIILWGQNEAHKKLGDSTIREFVNRCAQFQWQGLGKQFPQYLDFKLGQVGGNASKIFSADAIKALEERLMKKEGKVLWGPYPLELNVFITKCINLADRTGENVITAEIVDRISPLETRPEAR